MHSLRAHYRHLSPAVCLLLASLANAAAERPNVLFLIADDLGYGDLACFGHPEIETPNLDRLAASGLKLTSCYSAAANCSPARAGILTGRTPYRVGIYSALSETTPAHLRRSEITIATLLKQSGYATAMAGKWHLNGYFNLLTVHPQPNDHGFEHWFATQNNALPNHRNPYNFARNGIPVGPTEGYASALVAGEAVEWLTKHREKSRPFFLYVAFHEPHEPIATHPKFAARYEKKHADDPSRVAYYGSVTQMDDALGRILETLDSEGLASNTLVWFTSDNVPARTRWHNAGSTGGLRAYKASLYEGGMRVPGILRWPGRIPAGSVSAEPVIGLDVLPTLCELAGISPPSDRELDGASIVPIFRGGVVKRAKPLYWQYITAPGPQVALRDGPWKIMASLDGPRPQYGSDITDGTSQLIKQGNLVEFELYNVADDPRETRNLAASSPAKLAELKRALEKYHAGVRADAPVWPNYDNPGEEQKRQSRPNYEAKPLPEGKGKKR